MNWVGLEDAAASCLVSPLQNPGREDHPKGKQEAEADDDAVAISLA